MAQNQGEEATPDIFGEGEEEALQQPGTKIEQRFSSEEAASESVETEGPTPAQRPFPRTTVSTTITHPSEAPVINFHATSDGFRPSLPHGHDRHHTTKPDRMLPQRSGPKAALKLQSQHLKTPA
ncbi:hypothetical protein NDU88_003912 [Pleurodeles waltl]|uniref:Uncharacterized protein n=1 Tax=Pleurodeles waltl TaxID=8319 RepID=A0AAV7QD12_PLEWA|nr:hypothetical protein NDU88_003912 [Pleurodeles waltl]